MTEQRKPTPALNDDPPAAFCLLPERQAGHFAPAASGHPSEYGNPGGRTPGFTNHPQLHERI